MGMIWGYPYFRKHPYKKHFEQFNLSGCCLVKFNLEDRSVDVSEFRYGAVNASQFFLRIFGKSLRFGKKGNHFEVLFGRHTQPLNGYVDLRGDPNFLKS